MTRKNSSATPWMESSGPSRSIEAPCLTVVALDRCTDRSVRIASRWRRRIRRDSHRALILHTSAGNVGVARSLGVDAVLAGASAPGRVWVATTDADTAVPPHWSTRQVVCHERGVDLWTSRVTVGDWSGRIRGPPPTGGVSYLAESAPVHGASFGVNGAAYRRAGGFPALAHGEDQALYDRLVGLGVRPFHDPAVSVVTSGRSEARAPSGFAAALTRVERALEIPRLAVDPA